MSTLMNYETGSVVRAATLDELRASIAASKHDGGAGVITVDGERCYVDGKVRWDDVPVYDDTGARVYTERALRRMMREYRETGGIVGGWFVSVAGMTPEQCDDAAGEGPSVDEIDWTGIDE